MSKEAQCWMYTVLRQANKGPNFGRGRISGQLQVSARWLATCASILLCAGCVVQSTAQAAETPEPAVKLTVLPGERKSSGLTLELELRYLGQQKILISETSLPWRMQNSLLLFAVCLDGKNRVIPETYSL